MSNSICLDQQATTQSIIQGSSQSLNVRLVDGSTGDPMDLSNAGEIVAIFASPVDPGYIEKKKSTNQIAIASATGGRIMILLSPADTMALTPGPTMSFEVRVTISGVVSAVQILNSLNVIASLFPTAP